MKFLEKEFINGAYTAFSNWLRVLKIMAKNGPKRNTVMCRQDTTFNIKMRQVGQNRQGPSDLCGSTWYVYVNRSPFRYNILFIQAFFLFKFYLLSHPHLAFL